MIGRDELFALAEMPLGNRELQEATGGSGEERRQRQKEAASYARRAQKVWLPEGKKSTSTREARDAQKELLARNYDIEDAVVAAGGRRGGRFSAQ